ncbi:MAG: esterase family protein [Chloroflexi bacterium]|nr:esterase family protein [Chloroflexota bacterium]
MPQWDSFDSFLADAHRVSGSARQALVDELLHERSEWPWIEGNRATFIYSGMGTRSAALNMDVIKEDPPFAPMENLAETTLWYVTRAFERDDLLDYLLAVNDPLTPLATERDVVARMSNYWRVDPRNPLKMNTAQLNVSVLRMGSARPFPDWQRMPNVTRGRIYEHVMNSAQLGFSGRKLWVYTPPGYEHSAGQAYPLLIFQDGQWASGPLQLPFVADALIKHGRLEPMVVAMIQSGTQQERLQEYVLSDRYYAFTLLELLPFVQTQYRIDATNLGIGGVAVGAIAAAHAALKNPAVFERLIMISAPLGKGPDQDKLEQIVKRFGEAKVLPKRIFQSVGRYEARARFIRPAENLRDILSARGDVDYRFTEIGSGHGLVGFKSILPEALAWAFPVGVQ